MFQHVSVHVGAIIREPRPILCENYKSCSTVRVGTDVVSVMAAYCDLPCVRVVRCAKR